MSQLLLDVGVLLDEFVHSGWRDVYVRTDNCSLFIAKPAGVPNPMRKAFAQRAPLDRGSTAEVETTTVCSPHIGTVVSALEPGTQVEVGTVVCQIEVLEDIIPIKSEHSGVVDAVLVEQGALAEFDTPLVRIFTGA